MSNQKCPADPTGMLLEAQNRENKKAQRKGGLLNVSKWPNWQLEESKIGDTAQAPLVLKSSPSEPSFWRWFRRLERECWVWMERLSLKRPKRFRCCPMIPMTLLHIRRGPTKLSRETRTRNLWKRACFVRTDCPSDTQILWRRKSISHKLNRRIVFSWSRNLDSWLLLFFRKKKSRKRSSRKSIKRSA